MCCELLVRSAQGSSGLEGQTLSEMPGVILARVEADYKRPVRYGDTLEIRMVVAEIGRSSFRYEYPAFRCVQIVRPRS